MNVFQKVKSAITTKEAAEYYGISVRRNGMACCPFHNDKHPSMKVDQRFHCFACGANGDVIDFVSKLFSMTPKEAAIRLAGDFGIREPEESISRKTGTIVRNQKSKEQQMKEIETNLFRLFSDYLHLLEQWKIEYAPKNDNELWHPKFEEALSRITVIEYLLDILLYGSIRDRAFLILEYGKEVKHLERRISAIRSEVKSGIDQSNEQYESRENTTIIKDKLRDNRERTNQPEHEKLCDRTSRG